MNKKWDEYKQMLEWKIDDFKYNLELAEKRYLEAKNVYEFALKQKESYLKLFENKNNDIQNESI